MSNSRKRRGGRPKMPPGTLRRTTRTPSGNPVSVDPVLRLTVPPAVRAALLRFREDRTPDGAQRTLPEARAVRDLIVAALVRGRYLPLSYMPPDP